MLFTVMLLSLIHRGSHRRLQSHSRNGVWNSLSTNAALKDPLVSPLRPGTSRVSTSGAAGLDLQRLQGRQAVEGPLSYRGKNVPGKVPANRGEM